MNLRKIRRKKKNKSAYEHFRRKTFTVEMIEKQTVRFGNQIDERNMPKFVSKNGRCTICKKWCYPYAVCRECRENNQIRRYFKQMILDGEIEEAGRDNENRKLYRKVSR